MKCIPEIQISLEVLESPTLLDLKRFQPPPQHTNTLMHVLFIINGMQHENSNLGRGTGATTGCPGANIYVSIYSER